MFLRSWQRHKFFIHIIYAWKRTGEVRNLTVTKVTDNISGNRSKSSGQPNGTHLLHCYEAIQFRPTAGGIQEQDSEEQRHCRPLVAK